MVRAACTIFALLLFVLAVSPTAAHRHAVSTTVDARAECALCHLTPTMALPSPAELPTAALSHRAVNDRQPATARDPDHRELHRIAPTLSPPPSV